MDAFIGSILLFAGNFAPQGWALCNGQLLPINQNQALFAILGVQYGGDGTSTFALPNLNSASLDAAKGEAAPLFIICLNGIFPSRA